MRLVRRGLAPFATRLWLCPRSFRREALEKSSAVSEHTFVLLMTVGCLLIPRFSLIAAIGDRKEVLAGPAALAPEPGGEQLIGEVSGAAEDRKSVV